MNKLEILEIIELVRYLPNSPITGKESMESITKLYTAVLSDLPADIVRAATVQYLSESTPFFPMPGTLRSKAMDLQLLALGIPTGGEAWGMVLTAVSAVSRWCPIGADLREQYINSPLSGIKRKAYETHVDECPHCMISGLGEDYKHPAVAETVRLLGGRDVILTDNPAADRARFLEAYREVIERERMRFGMVPEVAETISRLQASNAVGLLANKMSHKQLKG